MENQPPQGSNEKRILLIGGVIFVVLGVCALVGSIFWGTTNVKQIAVSQEVKNEDARIQEILGLLNTPPEGQAISFGDLKSGKNEIGGVTLELFDIKSMKEGKSETTYVDELSPEQIERGVSPCSSGCNIVTDYYFSYAEKNIRLVKNDWISGGTAGEDISYDVFALDDQQGKWEHVGTFDSERDMKIIGVGNIIIFSGSAYHYHGIAEYDVFAYNLSEMKQVQTKNYISGTWMNDWADVFDGRFHKFYVKNQQLYLLGPEDQCYLLSNRPTYICSENCDMEGHFEWGRNTPNYIYAGCVSSYFPLSQEGTMTEQVETFTNEYTREAAKYDLIIKATDWSASSSTATSSGKYIIPKEVEDLYSGTHLLNFQFTSSLDLPLDANYRYPHPGEWLSPLLGRTLNMALAGQSDEAWKMFQEDYASLSKQYPLADPVDPIQVEHDLRTMTDGSGVATSTAAVEN